MTYEYRCRTCLHEWEVEARPQDPPMILCPECGEPTAQRLIGQTTFVLKGRGWAKDGYAHDKA